MFSLDPLQTNESGASFSPSLDQAEKVRTLLKTYDSLPKPSSPQEEGKIKSEKKEILENAYTLAREILIQPLHPDARQFYLMAADIFTRYGKLVYDEHYPNCMGMARASLSLQFVALGLLKTPDFSPKEMESLETLKVKALQHADFRATDDAILDEGLIETAFQRVQVRGSSEEVFLLAHTLSHFGFSCCHTAGYKEAAPLNIRRFENVYGLAKKLYELKKDDEKFRMELAELLYNGMRGLEMKKGRPLSEAHRHLDEAAILNPSLQMQARVANLKACDWHDIDFSTSLKFSKEALSIRERIAIEEQNPFLLANARNNFGSLLLKSPQPDLQEAEKYILLALEYAEARRGQRDETGQVLDPSNDHQYFGLYNTNMAHLFLLKNKPANALVHINRAIETFERHRENSEDMLAKAESLKKQIVSLNS